MNEPPQDRDPNKLHPMFLAALLSWREYASAWTHREIRIGECVRTQARQDWLWNEGRGNANKQRTWTQKSFHQFGLAADIFLVDKTTGAAIWDALTYQQLYAVSHPENFGLRSLGHMGDWPHLEWFAAQALIDSKAAYQKA